MQKIIFLMGVAGAGKTTVMTELMSHPKVSYIQSYSTRAMREGEVDGERYFFISREEFEQGIQNNEFLEYAFVHNRDYYGTKRSLIHDVQNKGKIPIKELDIVGREIISKQQDVATQCLTIFLDIDDLVMTTRILSRQADIDAQELHDRLTSADDERKKAQKLCHHIIDASQPVDTVIAQAKKIISDFSQQKN